MDANSLVSDFYNFFCTSLVAEIELVSLGALVFLVDVYF